jgi:hypothetical protein
MPSDLCDESRLPVSRNETEAFINTIITERLSEMHAALVARLAGTSMVLPSVLFRLAPSHLMDIE